MDLVNIKEFLEYAKDRLRDAHYVYKHHVFRDFPVSNVNIHLKIDKNLMRDSDSAFVVGSKETLYSSIEPNSFLGATDVEIIVTNRFVQVRSAGDIEKEAKATVNLIEDFIKKVDHHEGSP